MKVTIELTDEEKKQAFIDYVWKAYGIDIDDTGQVYPSLGQVVFYHEIK